MSIEPGAYEIQNVMHRNFASQMVGDNRVVAHAENSSIISLTGVDLRRAWSISRLDNDKYTIRNIDTNYYAASPNFPVVEGLIITTQDLQQWDIKETGIKGRYVIYTTAADIDLFWGLTNGNLHSPISLRDRPNTPSNQWEVTKIDSWQVVSSLRVKLAGIQGERMTLRGELRKLQDENIDEHRKLRDEHNQLQDEHDELQDEHRKLQDQCAQLQDKHTQLQYKHDQLQDKGSKLQDEHAKLCDEYTRLQDDHSKLSDGVELLNADARQERARHVQTESELRAFYERRSRRDEARRLQADAELRASYERASRQERARQLQAEAELKAHYEKLLAEEVRRAEKWRFFLRTFNIGSQITIMVQPRKTTTSLTSFLLTTLFTLASTRDAKRQAQDPAVLSAPYPDLTSSSSSFNWWPYPPGGVDASSSSIVADPYWTPLVSTITATSASTFSVVASSSFATSDGDTLSTSTVTSIPTATTSSSTSIITLTALPPLTTTTTTTTTPHATTSHANHPLLPASPASSSQSSRKDKVQAIVLGSLLGCALGAVIGWIGVGFWRSRKNASRKKGSRGTRVAKRTVKGIRYEDVRARKFPDREKNSHHGRVGDDKEEEADAFIGQSHPSPFAFDEQDDLGPPQNPSIQANDNEEDKDTLTRSWLARTFTAHRRDGASLSRAFSSGNGGGFLQPPNLSREPIRTAFSTSLSSATPTPNPIASTGMRTKRPIMTPAPTIFSSTASSYEYEFDGDDEVYDSARLFTSHQDGGEGVMGRKRGLLEKLKRWTGAHTYSPAADVSGGVGGNTRGRTPELEAGVLYSQSPLQSPLRSESGQSDEVETSSLARVGNTTTSASQFSKASESRSRRHPNSRRSQIRGYGHRRADSDVTIQPPLPSYTLPDPNEEYNDGDTYTAIPPRAAARRSTRSRSRSRSTSPVKRTIPTLPISEPVLPTDETSTIPRLVGGRPHPGPLPRVDSTILPLSPPLLSSLPLEQSLMFTSMLSLGGGQYAGPYTGIGGIRRGVALVDPPVRQSYSYGLRVQDVGPVMDSPYSPDKSECDLHVAVSQDDSESLSNTGPVVGKIGTGTGAGKNVNGPRKLKSTRRRAATATVARDKTLPAPPPAPLTSIPTPTRAVGRVLTRKTPGGARDVQGCGSTVDGHGTEQE
ncbi:hypothetical protein BD410DRAFT_804499 [Rickenella mellea]|uniref:Uncharacterized protein n=1 Tax=Rickenella mellea TaxID=50990 RepID=A0A4Y7Q2H7_9AGAM|nr:hypothetical protein BD410DRAFT_804499 [Rickenella mellea]